MENKKIYVDGVDVSKCEFYMHYDYGKFSHGCSLHKDMFGLPVCCDIADCCKDCYFKQLARKTQECESLKEEIEVLKDNFDTATRDCNELIEELKQECEELKEENQQLRNNLSDSLMFRFTSQDKQINRYRKALEEIERYINNQGIDNKWNMRIQRFRSGILDIINKAKGKSNG